MTPKVLAVAAQVARTEARSQCDETDEHGDRHDADDEENDDLGGSDVPHATSLLSLTVAVQRCELRHAREFPSAP